ncbi:MAG: HU family DNA-binding protein [Syntrophobacteraceae bacterium]
MANNYTILVDLHAPIRCKGFDPLECIPSGFGKLSVKERDERRDRHPQTGEPMMLPPGKSDEHAKMMRAGK